jgi:hypothetical protein
MFAWQPGRVVRAFGHDEPGERPVSERVRIGLVALALVLVMGTVGIPMHDGTLEFRLEELTVAAGASLSGSTLRSAQRRDRAGALVLAIRRPEGGFVTNPSPEDVIEAGDGLISVGTANQLDALARYVARP